MWRPGRRRPTVTTVRPPRLLVAVCAAPLLWAAGPGVDAPGEVRLRLKGEPGDSATYRYETRASVTPPPRMGMPTEVTTRMVVLRTLESVTPDSLRYRARIEDFFVDIASGDDRAAGQLEDRAEQARRNAVGSRFWLTVTPSGEMIRLRREEGDAVEGARVEQSLRHLTFAELPRGPVAVGDSWTGADTLDAVAFGSPMPGTVVADVRTTLASIDRSGDRPVAVLRVEGTYELHQDTAAARSGFKGEMQGSSARTVRFDVERGRFLGAEGSQDMTVNLSVPGAPGGSLSVRTSVRHSARLVRGG